MSVEDLTPHAKWNSREVSDVGAKRWRNSKSSTIIKPSYTSWEKASVLANFVFSSDSSRKEVGDFLDENPSLIKPLQQAPVFIAKEFPDSPVFLNLGAAGECLFLEVETDLPLDQANQKVDAITLAWSESMAVEQFVKMNITVL